MSKHSPLRVLAAVGSGAALLAFAACGGSDQSSTGPSGTVAVAAPASAPSIEAGKSGTATVTVTRGGGYAGAVTLAIGDLPAGITASAAPSTLQSGVTQSVITANVGASVAAGSYGFTVTASAPGLTSSHVTVPVTVIAAGTTSGIAIAGASTLAVKKGESATGSFTLTRTSYTGDVTLSAENLPSGVTASFAPATLTGSTATSTMTLAASGSATAGTATIVVRAKGTGVADATASVALTVSASSTSGDVVALNFCSTDLPVWVGYQSGNGSWTRATGSGGTFSATIDTRGAVAYVEKNGSAGSPRYDLTVAYGTVAELKTAGAALCAAEPTGSKHVSGSVAGTSSEQFANVALGPKFTVVFPAGDPTFAFDGVPSGALDLVAARVTLDLENAASSTVDRIILRRGLDLADGSTIPVLDFSQSEAFAPATGKLTVGNLGADTANAAMGLYGTGMGTGLGFIGEIRGPVDYAGLPSAKLLSSEMHYILVGATGAGDGHSGRGAMTYFRDVADRTVTLGAPLASVAVTNVGSSTILRPQATLAAQADYGAMVTTTFEQNGRSAQVSVSKGYLGSTPSSWTVAVPDLTGAPGWDAAWNLVPNTATSYEAQAYGGDLSQLLGGTPSSGGQLLYALHDGTAFATAPLFSAARASRATVLRRPLGPSVRVQSRATGRQARR